MATLGELTSCLRNGTHFTATATDLNPANPSQLVVYSEERKAYTAAGEASRQRAEGTQERVELEMRLEHREQLISELVE